jgi:DNA-binding PadR family transcriptional regulator
VIEAAQDEQPPIRLTRIVQQVLHELLDGSDPAQHYAAAIAAQLGHNHVTIMYVLRRLERVGWVASWPLSAVAPTGSGRMRRMVGLTEQGHDAAREALADAAANWTEVVEPVKVVSWADLASLASLVELRKRAGLSQRDVADKMHVTQSVVAGIEARGVGGLLFTTLLRYIDALGGTLRVAAHVGDEDFIIHE